MFQLSYAIMLYTSSFGTYLQPANQIVKNAVTFGPFKITKCNFTGELSLSKRTSWARLNTIAFLVFELSAH